MRRMAVVPLSALFLALSGSVGVPAGAMPAPAGGPGGFATDATATPVRIEVYEPAIPVPAEPQGELNLSYSHVEGTSGPSARARASSLWPGDPVGEGFKTIGDTVGLPPQLTKGGYPVQANAQTPGSPDHASQEPLPGMVSRARADQKSAVAAAGYDSAGDVQEDSGQSGDGSGDGSGGGSSPVPGLPALPGTDGLASLTDGLGALTASGGQGTTSTSGDDAKPAAEPANPLGALSAVVDAGTASSISRTSYASETVVATSTSYLGDVRLLGGIVRLRSVTTTARTQSNLGGARSTSSIRYAGLTIAGTPFELTKHGVRAAGQSAPIPGLPDDPAKALEALGVSMSLPRPVVTRDGVRSGVDVHGIKVTLDTTTLRSKLPSLPVDKLTSGFPDSANQLKGLLLALNEAHPRIVVYLGTAQSEALSVPPVSFDFPTGATGGGPTTGAATGGTAATAGSGAAGVAGAGTAGSAAPVTGGASGGGAAAGGAPAQVQNVNATPGLPKLGTVPGMLMMGGLALAGAAGWWMRRAGLLVLGGAANCPHGLASGIPDLRKA